MQSTHRKNLESKKKSKTKLPILTFESGPKKRPDNTKRKAAQRKSTFADLSAAENIGNLLLSKQS